MTSGAWGPAPSGAKSRASADGGGWELDPSTPCSASVGTAPAGGGGGDGAVVAASPAPITPLSQTVPALEPHIPFGADGAASVSFSAASCRPGTQPGASPPSVTSYPKARAKGPQPPLPLQPSQPAVAEAAADRGGEAAVSEAGASEALGADWNATHERLAVLHAGVLCGGHVACLQDEVAELLYLLACPPELLVAAAVDSSAGAATPTAAAAGAVAPAFDAVGTAAAAAARQLVGGANGEWSLPTAVRYACSVLARCGGLLSGLGHRLLAAVATCAAARLAAPTLAEAAEAAAQQRERSLARARAVDALGGTRLQLVGPMLQSGSDMASGKSRSQEQQRRVSNRERCRDMFFAAVRQAAGLINRDGVEAPASASATAEQLIPLRAQAGEVLAALHPDNLPFFAELFTGCVLQAAATGESLVEGDLASLASRNPSRFQRLNQRMQQALLVKALGGPSPPAPTAAGAAAAASLGPLGDHVVASGTLASYLAYLSAVHGVVRLAGGAAPDGGVDCTGAEGSGAAASAGAAADTSALPLQQLSAVAGWLRRLLAAPPLQPHQPAFGAAALCLRSAAEEALAHAASATSAGNDADTTATGRADSSPHAAPATAAATGAGDAAAGEPDWLLSVESRDTRLARSLQDSDGLVDMRLLEICCPAIEEVSRVLQRAAAAAAKQQQQQSGVGAGGRAPPGSTSPGAGAGGESRPLPPRRVPPAALVRLGAASGAAGGSVSAIPESVAAVLAAPGPSPLSAALAQALLGQYSTGEHALPMRDVVAYVTGALAVNGAAAALEVIVPKVASEQLAAMAKAARPLLRARLRRWQPDGDEGGSTKDAGGASAPPFPLSEALSATAALAEAASAAATRGSLEAALPAVRRQLNENALKSLQALLPGTVPEEAVAAAAALAAQSAEVACLQRLVAHVPTAVRHHMDEQVKHVVREVLREVERQAVEGRLAVEEEAEAAEAAAAGGGGGAKAEGGGGGAAACSTAGISAAAAASSPARVAATDVAASSPAAASSAECEAAGVSEAQATEATVAEAEAKSRAAEAGRRLGAALVELGAEAADPSADELVLLAAEHMTQAAPPHVSSTETALGAMAAAAAVELYSGLRTGAINSAVLECLLIRCLRTASAAALAAVAAAATATTPWTVEPMEGSAATAASTADGAAALTLLAEVALAVVQCHANAADGWTDAVWAPDGELAEESAAAGGRPPGSLPPMLTNVCHQLAAYARDVESYRMLKSLRLALQRITMGAVARNAALGV
ncbi:hypothetical protein GPECTOR_44g42 [Gonium pectorale]|uniref:Uncharacterized protein n=1 Tax=Gonium pectorale TaxID=33097 RepID=A0A150G9X5_GONPE|nr:hypothetical protein GPECTOR_44g42 [Gonium pectorale]|eukprot:KXZ46365.1 hypothetical protein GPECTOR_44g42 [Gonium pectorale]